MRFLKSSLSAQDALELATRFLDELVPGTTNVIHIEELCTRSESVLARIKRADRKTRLSSTTPTDIALCYDIAANYQKQADLWKDCIKNVRMSERVLKKKLKWKHPSLDKGNAPDTELQEEPHDSEFVSMSFPASSRKEATNPSLALEDEHLTDTPQLVYSLRVLQTEDDEELARKLFSETDSRSQWARAVTKHERERLRLLATQIAGEFINDNLKDASTIDEVTCLAPILSQEHYRTLVSAYVGKISTSPLLDITLVQGLPRLIQSAAKPDFLQADDLVMILQVLNERLRNTHKQTPGPQQRSTSSQHVLVMAISRVLDAMTHSMVKNLDQPELHRPLSELLDGLRTGSDAYLVYQAAYALQALKNVPGNESDWKQMLRQGGEFVGAAVGLGISVYSMDIPGFMAKLENLQVNAQQIFEVLFITYETASALIEGGQGLRDSFQTAFNYQGKQPWYQELRLADILIQNGDLVQFERLVRCNDHRAEPSFQWGVCQRLGEIAANPHLLYEARERALEFLGEIFSNDTFWTEHPLIKQLVIAILLQLQQLPLSDGAWKAESPVICPASVPGVRRASQQTPQVQDNEQLVQKKAEALIAHLGKRSKGPKKALYNQCLKNPPYPYPLRLNEPARKLGVLLQRVQQVPDIENDLQALKKRRLEQQRDKGLYIEPSVKSSLLAPEDAKKSLMTTVMEFLDRDGRVLLLLGDSGAGKSTFNKKLELELWNRYQPNDWIPLHINLPEIDRPHQDLIGKHLRRNDFTEPQIREMKKRHKFTLICDGYDESQQKMNLYESNELTINPKNTSQWTAKMVISCRSEYLSSKYQELFQPPPRTKSSANAETNGAVNAPAIANALAATNILLNEAPVVGDIPTVDDFKEVEIAPFTSDNIEEYVWKYVNGVSTFDAAVWRTQEYMDVLKKVPNLLDLVKNPFLLTLSLEVLPRVIDVRQKDLSGTSITRVRLYDQFVEHWLERGKKRLRRRELSQHDRTALNSLDHEGFAQNGVHFLKRLAAAIYKEQSGQPVVEYVRFRDEKTWKEAFFKREDEMRILREACPLAQSGKQYRFIHRSLLEYCFSLAIFDPQESKAKRLNKPKIPKIPKIPNIHKRRTSISSISSCDESPVHEKEPPGTQPAHLRDHPLSWRSLVHEPSLLQFLVERVQEHPWFKKQLLELIELSKKFPKAHRAAANAITILVRSGHSFNGVDLSGIHIKGADLSGGDFDSALLQGADLRNVNLRNIWLREADLSKANLEGATFGESPYLVQRSGVQCCVFDPKGEVCALGLCNNEIKLYETATWKEWRTLKGHKDMVAIVVYSPDGTQIASGSDDRTLRLWNPLESSDSVVIFSGHTGRVECLVYSPIGDLIASCSTDKTVRLWNYKTLQAKHILRGHNNSVMSVVFSPSGEHVASGSYDNTVRIWSTRDGSHVHTLQQHTKCVKSVVYSPDGKNIASAGYDNTVRVWDSKTGAPIHTLQHEDMVGSVAYSPNGLQIAAASGKQVQLWDAKLGSKQSLLSGHTDAITNVVYSPSGHQIVSSSYDKTARLWDTQSGASGLTLNGHINNIMSIVYAPNGYQIATASLDKTVRLWDSYTGVSIQMSGGHTDRVNSVTYSPKGCTLASGGFDRTLRLWNAKTGTPIKTYGDQTNQITSGNDSQVPAFDVGRIERAAYSPCGGHVALGSDNGCVYIWDLTTGALIHKLIGHDECVTSVTYSADGKMIASGSDDWTVFLWDAESGTRLHRLVEHSKGVTDVAFSPCGNHIASGSFDKALIIWRADSGHYIKKLPGHTDMITSVVYSPDGKRIASGSNDRTVRVWDVETGVSTELRGHTDRVRSVVFSPCGQEIASGSLDNTVKLWKVGSSHKPTEIKVFQSPIRSIAWVKNNSEEDGPEEDRHDEDCHDKDWHDKNDPNKKDIVSFIAVGSDDKSVRVWSVKRTEDALQVRLQWNSTHDRLVVSGAKFEKTRGLSEMNMKLMEQRGAKGTSSYVVEQQQRKIQAKKFREAIENIAVMKTVVDKMRPEQGGEPDVSSSDDGTLPGSPQESTNVLSSSA